MRLCILMGKISWLHFSWPTLYTPTVPQRHGQTDRRTDGLTTYDSNTALALRVSRGKNRACRKETARCHSSSFRFKVRRQHSLEVQEQPSSKPGFKLRGAKQNLTENGHSRSLKVTCFGVSGKAIRD